MLMLKNISNDLTLKQFLLGSIELVSTLLCRTDKNLGSNDYI